MSPLELVGMLEAQWAPDGAEGKRLGTNGEPRGGTP
jgi:hypothetical protein